MHFKALLAFSGFSAQFRWKHVHILVYWTDICEHRIRCWTCTGSCGCVFAPSSMWTVRAPCSHSHLSFPLTVYFSIHPSIPLTVYFSIQPSIHFIFHPLTLFCIHPSPTIHPSIHPSSNFVFHPSIHSLYFPSPITHPSIHPSIHLLTLFFIHPSTHFIFHPLSPIHPSIHILTLFFIHPFTFMHLADAFIQSDLQCIQVIQVIHFLSVHVFPGNRTHNLCAASAML